jgi:hypothetical protein
MILMTLHRQKNAKERISPSVVEKVGGWCRFSLNRAEGLATKPYHARFTIPRRKRLGDGAIFHSVMLKGWQPSPITRVSSSLAEKVGDGAVFSLSHAERLATKPYRARFAIPRQKSWGTAPFFAKSRRGADNEALLLAFCHPSPKRLWDGVVFH